jgi:L-alanine-DL-glutamate epimerase-like enolase superfamily enzyme
MVKEPYEINRGWLQLNDKPGYGLEVIDDVERSFLMHRVSSSGLIQRS